MSEEEIIQEIEKLELEEEKEKTVKYLLKVVIEGKKDIIQEKEFFLNEKEQEIEELKAIINKEHENNLDKRYVEFNFISKDKIMEIAKEYIEDETIDLHGFYMKVMRLLGD